LCIIIKSSLKKNLS